MNADENHQLHHLARDREKARVAMSSLLAAVLLTGMKLVVGLATNSLGILSEAAHSGFDLIAAGVTFWAVRISGQPADREHTYGHGKVENLSALFETLLLLATCVWIIYEALNRLLWAESVEVEANVWAFLVMIISIAVDYSRSRSLMRVAKKHDSQALEADALHFSTDIWSSVVVLVGLTAVFLAERWQIAWLPKADALAALGVALIVIYVSVRLGRRAVDELLDRVPQHLQEELAAAAAGVPGVEQVKQVRVRRSGADVFADITLTVDQTAAFVGAHAIADEAESAVCKVLPKADVVVHVEPSAPLADVPGLVRTLAAQQHLGIHGIQFYEEEGQICLELHLEVDPTLRLEDAHQQATQFEGLLRDKVPGLARIVTHIEPAIQVSQPARAEPIQEQDGRELQVHRAIREYFHRERRLAEPHHITVQMVAGELAVSLHCRLDPQMAIVDAHEITRQLEAYLRQRVSGLGRVTVHVEPAKS